jgi:hypothetical protein
MPARRSQEPGASRSRAGGSESPERSDGEGDLAAEAVVCVHVLERLPELALDYLPERVPAPPPDGVALSSSPRGAHA